MKEHNITAVHLHTLFNVTGSGSAFAAISNEPWLKIESNIDFKQGPWVEVIYCTSYLDTLVRPLLRCVLPDDYHDEILPAPVFGRAIWRGPLPAGTLSLQISPLNQTGSFHFKIESLRVMSKLELLGRAVLKRPRKALLGVLSRVGGYRYLARVNLRHALGATPLEHYSQWLKTRYRQFDVDGFDGKTASKTLIILTCKVYAADKDWLNRFITELQAQPYKHWCLHIQSGILQGNVLIDDVYQDTRIYLGKLPCISSSLIMMVSAGTYLYPYALSVLAHNADTHSEADIFYADTDEISVNGLHHNPHFRPDFDPLLFTKLDYLGYAFCVRRRAFEGDMDAYRASLMSISLPKKTFHHIARVFMGVESKTGIMPERLTKEQISLSEKVSIIIPTKNQHAIFKRCMDSIFAFSNLLNVEIIIINNGSFDVDAVAYLKELEAKGVKVLDRPGPFNFSRLCNDGAKEATSDFLVFLNNDTEITHSDWLEKLCFFASKPDVGAVGAKLLYADRRLQHGGVILGLDGRAGHFERLVGEHDLGYFGRLNATHETASVTGACLAVEAAKFWVSGGFDEINLPVDLNDIDLCLRLKTHGWKSVFVSDVVLVHHESVSRTGSWKPDKVYALERTYFKKRWINDLRDCPNFHPALSLEGFKAALG